MALVGATSNPRIDDLQRRDDGTDRYRGVFTYAGPASYVTGGDPFAASDVNNIFSLATITSIDDALSSNPFFNGTNIAEVTYNSTNGTLQWFDPSTKAEIGNGTNLSAYTGRIEIVCH